MKKKTLKQMVALSLFGIALMAGGSLLNGQEADAHGLVASPPSRSAIARAQKSIIGWGAAIEKYGKAADNPYGIEGLEGFPEKGPKDGEIASAAAANGSLDYKLDIQTPDYWTKTEMQGGVNSFTWEYSMAHATRKWDYFITKKGWNPNEPLSRANLEKIGEVQHDGSLGNTNLTHQINVPTDRSGYHVILAVWETADTDKSFYQAIDVNLKNDGETPIEDKEAPTQVKNLKQTAVTTSTINLTFEAATDNVGVKEYKIFRNGQEIDTIAGTSYEDKNLTPDTTYEYTVQAIDFAGNKSVMSSVLKAKTLAMPEEDKEAPTTPINLHSMGQTANSASLMWAKSSDNVAVKEYIIYRNGTKVATATGTHYEDKGLTPETAYKYQVSAIDAAGNESAKSTPLTITTEAADEAENEWKVGSFTNPILYTAGQTVTHLGVEYQVLQTHQNYGDAMWAPNLAPALFLKK